MAEGYGKGPESRRLRQTARSRGKMYLLQPQDPERQGRGQGGGPPIEGGGRGSGMRRNLPFYGDLFRRPEWPQFSSGQAIQKRTGL